METEQLRAAVAHVLPGRIRAGARRPVQTAERERINRALDQLRDQQTEALFLFSQGEPLYDQLLRQRQLERLDSWPNVIVEQIPSGDHMFRARWLQRYVHVSVDRALERSLARSLCCFSAPGPQVTWKAMTETMPATAAAAEWLDAKTLERLVRRLEVAHAASRAGGAPTIVSVTGVCRRAQDPTALIAASRRPGEPWFCFEQPDRDGSALAALGSVRALEEPGGAIGCR